MQGSKDRRHTGPVVFISWAHRDSSMTDKQAETWSDLVRALAERLRQWGCDAQLDLYQRDVDWSRWGPEMVDKSDYTLIVPSLAYRQRWDGLNPPDEGAGATREINVLKGRFDKNQQDFRDRTLLAILPGITIDDVPNEIYSFLQRFDVDPLAKEGLKSLLRHLTRQPEFALPGLGIVPDLPPRPSVTDKDRVPEPDSDENQTLTAQSARWLPTATAHRDPISCLISEVDGANSPPSRPSGSAELSEWMARLANWVDDISLLVDRIEHTRALIPNDPSVRFVQALDTSHATIQEMVDHLDGPRTATKADSLADTALDLFNLVKKLARLSLEP